MARRSIWEELDMYESSEGPNVTLSLPREVAEQLLGLISGALEIEGGGDEGGLDDLGDDMGDMDLGGDMGMDPPGGDMTDDEPEFGADDPLVPAGDDEEEDAPPPPPKKRPSGDKKPEKKKDDDKGKDKKDESARRLGAYIPSRGRR